ncbi:hypothetical protein B5X24_HaOG206133 [Helicoverpa armigera]|uniref:Uncharacterized protein n=1 Tax=Helicoverpa armigera TaxID=29058 RepID=A0A2W1BUI1_HELAM|nr:hypothetical protein B5X24_HaOG206133 [Helicoverpa armigera]
MNPSENDVVYGSHVQGRVTARSRPGRRARGVTCEGRAGRGRGAQGRTHAAHTQHQEHAAAACDVTREPHVASHQLGNSTTPPRRCLTDEGAIETQRTIIEKFREHDFCREDISDAISSAGGSDLLTMVSAQHIARRRATLPDNVSDAATIKIPCRAMPCHAGSGRRP